MINYEEIPMPGDYWLVKVMGGMIKSIVYIERINNHYCVFKDHYSSKESREHLTENIVFIRRTTWIG